MRGHARRASRAPRSTTALLVAVELAPHLLVQAAWRANPSMRSQPVAVLDDAEIVLAACLRAVASGVARGQRFAQARLACPALCRVPVDLLGAAVLYEDLLQALGTLSPVIEAADPATGLAFLDARGLERLLGDPSDVAGAAISAAADIGLVVRASAGPTRRIARALAQRMDPACPPLARSTQEGTAFLRSLPLADPVFGIDPGDLQRLDEVGIWRAEQLEALPRAPLMLRFGQQVLDSWDALHDVPESPLVPWSAPAIIDVAHQSDDELQDRLVLEQVLARLAAGLAGMLADRQQAAMLLTLRASSMSGATQVQRLHRWPPLATTHDLGRAAAALLDQLHPATPVDLAPAPVTALILSAGGLCGVPVDQQVLWGDPGAARQARLDAVLQAQARRYGAGMVTRWREDPLADEGWRRDDWTL